MIAPGQIRREDKEGFWVFVPCQNHKEAVRQCSPECLVEFIDSRRLSDAQRRKAYVLNRAISEYTGYTPAEVIKWQTKTLFKIESASLSKWFSLSNCTMEEARLYISWLIDFCLANQIPCGEPMWKLAEDIPRYIYACLMTKSCCVCGKKAVLHHAYHPVAMGANRREKPQLGMLALPLCGKHHAEIHQGERDFIKRYILEPVRIDERIADVYRFTRKAKRQASEYDTRPVKEGRNG